METMMKQNPDEDAIPHIGTAEGSSLPQDSAESIVGLPPEVEPSTKRRPRTVIRGSLRRYWAVLALLTYLAGLGSGFMLWGRQASESASNQRQADHLDMKALAGQINPKNGYELPATYGEIGPRLVEAGAIDLDEFVKIYQEMGKPLSEEQLAILTKGSNDPIVINQDNQHFLLNLFWAFGLANQNRVLTEGPMMRNGKEGVVKFASTGGWTLAANPIIEIYANSLIISLTEEQQKRLEEVAQGVYRPCCDNPTHFPDCNHGMAMLGLLELMAAQGASVGAMFEAAKYVNAYWFPRQALELAVLFKTAKNLDFAQVDAPQVVGQQFFSGSGFQAVHQWLAQNGKLDQAPDGGGSCGVK